MGSIASIEVEELSERIAAACRACGVLRLELFGSAARQGLDETTHDVDLLIELEPPAGVAYADAYFDLKEALEEVFGRPVELLSLASLSNPHFLEAIAPDRRLLYAA